MFDAKVQAVMDQVDRLREQVSDHWQIPKVQALVLAQLVRLHRAVSLCEIGTSYGFSTLHLAAAANEQDGHVHSFDIDPQKIERATEHLRQAGLLSRVTLHLGDARQQVAAVEPRSPYDFVFLDATKNQSGEYLDAVFPKLAQRALLVTDNTTTHSQELAPFVARLRRLPGAKSCHVPLGNGFEWTLIQR